MPYKTPLYEEHIALNGKIVDFAGWELPVYYTGIIEEHQAVRSAIGMFDVSHLGRIQISGNTAFELIQSISTNDITSLQPGNIMYSLVCNPAGGIEDDILVCRDSEDYFLVVNAVNTDKILNIIKEKLASFPAQINHFTFATAMIAVQGPNAIKLIEKLFPGKPGLLKKYQFIRIGNLVLSRTGYTGEDGFELIVQANEAGKWWKDLLEKGQEFGIKPCGLGSRDTLRLEAGNCLYGHEMNSNMNPYEAGLGFAVKLNKPDFIGKEALAEIKQKGITQKLVGLEMTEGGIPRDGYSIMINEQPVGKVTSGSFIPSLKKSVALGYVPVEYSTINTKVMISIRNKFYPAVIVTKKWR
jgi:aminomethyltransferase